MSWCVVCVWVSCVFGAIVVLLLYWLAALCSLLGFVICCLQVAVNVVYCVDCAFRFVGGCCLGLFVVYVCCYYCLLF